MMQSQGKRIKEKEKEREKSNYGTSFAKENLVLKPTVIVSYSPQEAGQFSLVVLESQEKEANGRRGSH